jgi:hypothetical protein
LHNISSNSLNLDQSIGEQVREQVRIAQEYDRYEEEQRQKLLSQQSPDNDELKRLVNKLHTEGIEKKIFSNFNWNTYKCFDNKKFSRVFFCIHK